MKVYKATDADMSCHMGKGVFPYELGVTAYADKSKCGETGLHACEYVLDCVRYYSLDRGHRFFLAEASGDIAEDGSNTRISCTELTLIKELSNRDIAREALLYMKHHPKRDGWKISTSGIMVAEDEAWCGNEGGIAIARGRNPRVKGGIGAYLGLIQETKKGIVAVNLFTVDGPILPDTWYTLDALMDAFEKGGAA